MAPDLRWDQGRWNAKEKESLGTPCKSILLGKTCRVLKQINLATVLI